MWASHVPYNSKKAKAFPYAIGTEDDYIYTEGAFEVVDFGGLAATAALGFGATDRVAWDLDYANWGAYPGFVEEEAFAPAYGYGYPIDW